jgi:hypothetical protein
MPEPELLEDDDGATSGMIPASLAVPESGDVNVKPPQQARAAHAAISPRRLGDIRRSLRQISPRFHAVQPLVDGDHSTAALRSTNRLRLARTPAEP